MLLSYTRRGRRCSRCWSAAISSPSRRGRAISAMKRLRGHHAFKLKFSSSSSCISLLKKCTGAMWEPTAWVKHCEPAHLEDGTCISPNHFRDRKLRRAGYIQDHKRYKTCLSNIILIPIQMLVSLQKICPMHYSVSGSAAYIQLEERSHHLTQRILVQQCE